MFQVKHKETDQSPAENLNWLKSQISQEFKTWMRRAHTEPVPRNLLFITNARLSATAGVDAIDDFIKAQLDKNHGTEDKPRSPRGLGVRECAVWHRAKVDRLVDTKDAIRNAYPALLTAGDIVAKIQSLPGDVNPEDLALQLVGHAQSTILNERWVRVSEASDTTQKQPIDQVIIDLPCSDAAGNTTAAVRHCLWRGEHNLRRSQWRQRGPRNVVITGAPGNGKSTISSFITQVYRSQFLEPQSSADQIRQLGSATREALARIGVPCPQTRRWPIRVDLADMGADMGPSGELTVMRYLSERITKRCDIVIQPVALRRWLRGWPCVVVFDGLDEVTNQHVRDRVLEEIEAFIQEGDREDWDLLAIITTRPTGYTERFMPDDFEQIDLTHLSPQAAMDYAQRVTLLRLENDQQHALDLLARFREAARQETIARLILTPLQILMLTFIIEQGATLATNRYQLFWGYYKAVYRREANKKTSLRAFFQQYEEVIQDLHTRAGLILHCSCESSGDARPKLPRSHLEQVARDRLLSIGLTGETTVEAAVSNLLEVAHTRLILLVADEDDTVSFEVRSLQEVMAARALTDGSDDQIRTNLRVTAVSPHWRNAWLFAAGRLFEDNDHKRDLVTALIEELDLDPTSTGWLYPVAPSLAAEVILDGMAEFKPRWLRRLSAVTARVLDGPMPDDAHTIAKAFERISSCDPTATRLIRNKLEAAFAGSLEAAAVASVLTGYQLLVRVPGQPPEAARLKDAWLTTPLEVTNVTSASAPVLAVLNSLTDDQWDPAAVSVRAALAECAHLRLATTSEGWTVPHSQWSTHQAGPLLLAAATGQDSAAILRLCLDELEPNDWAARSVLAHAVYLATFRRSVGIALQLPYLTRRAAQLSRPLSGDAAEDS